MLLSDEIQDHVMERLVSLYKLIVSAVTVSITERDCLIVATEAGSYLKFAMDSLVFDACFLSEIRHVFQMRSVGKYPCIRVQHVNSLLR